MKFFLKKKKFNSQISRNKNSRKLKEKKVHKTMNGSGSKQCSYNKNTYIVF